MDGGNAAGYGGEVGFAGVLRAGHGGEECFGVGVARVGKELMHLCALYDAAAVHDDDAVAMLGDEAEVVRDEDGRGAHVFFELAQEGKDLLLHGDVQRGGGLICNDEFGAAGQGNGNDNALAHTAGEGHGVLVDAGLGVGDMDVAEHFYGFSQGGLAGEAAVEHEGFCDLVADAVHGVEGAEGLLKDDTDLTAAQLAQAVVGHFENVFTIKHDAPAQDFGGRLGQQAYKAHGGDAFTAAAFSHNAYAFAAGDIKADIIYGAHGAGLCFEGGGKVAYL